VQQDSHAHRESVVAGAGLEFEAFLQLR
jgi:hypothetical protein